MGDARAGAPAPRYSSRPFPSYRFLPGHTPHPRRRPDGHSYGQPEIHLSPIDPADWAGSDDYRYGIDLFNGGYWWESHEIFEGFWHACGRRTEQGRFFRTLIQVAAAHLKRVVDHPQAADAIGQRALAGLHDLPTDYMGIDLADLTAQFQQWLDHSDHPPVTIRLELEE